MSELTYQSIMHDLAGMLGNFNGRQYGGRITPKTWFSADLGLASIDAVVLGEMIENHYRRKLPFGRFMADLGRQGPGDVEVGTLAEFLHKHLSEPVED